MARATKAALASSNVVMLPTAAPRRVDNYRYADQRRASSAARNGNRFAERYKHHQEREAERLAADLTAIGGGFNLWLQRLRRTSQLGFGTSRFFSASC